MTATLTAPANGAGGGKATISEYYDLPLGIRCDILGITGAKWSGKTVFAMSVAPGHHPAGHKFAGQGRTLALDFEKSGVTYNVPGVERIDVPDLLRVKFGDRDYSPLDIWNWFREYVLAIPVGRYDSIYCDPWTDIESGLSQYVRGNPGMFGYTSGQFAKMEAIAINCAKIYAKKVLLDLASRCKVMTFIAHQKREWKGNQPTANFVAKGMDTLYEVASLYLELQRQKPAEGEKPKPPGAILLKERLSYSELDPETCEVKWIQILPGRLPEATPAAIRKYVKHPVGKRRDGLKPDEIATEATLSADDKLLIEAEMAANRKETATIELSRLQLMQQNAAAQAAQFNSVTAAANKPAANARPPISQSQIASIVTLLTDLFGGPSTPDAAAFLAPRVQAAGVEKVTQFTDAQGDGLQSELLALSSQRRHDAMKDRGAELMAGSPDSIRNQPPVSQPPVSQPVASEPPFVPDSPALQAPAAPPQPPTAEQKAEANHLIPLAFPDPNTRGAKLPALCLKHGAPNPKDLTYQQMESVLVELRQLSTAALVPLAPRARPETIAKLRDHCEKTGWSRDKQQQWLESNGFKTFSEASDEQICSIIEMLINIESSFSSGGPPGN